MIKHNFKVERVLCCVLLLFADQLSAGSDTFIDFEATLGFDDNVTRAAQDADIEHDGFLTLAGTGGYELAEGRAGVLVAKILLEANRFSRYEGLSNFVAAGKLNYTFGFGSGFGVPWYSLDAGYGVAEFESNMRDSNILRATATMGMQIDDATSMRIGVIYVNRDAESAVFDTEDSSFFASLDWAVSQKNIVYVTYKYQQGDITSSASDPPLAVIDAATAIAPDDVFDGKLAYRLDGSIQFVTLGYNLVTDLHSSFDFSARYLQADATDVDLDYEDLVVRASYFHRFDL
jgi:hypothetical protein